jgi:hypothetical protein
LRIGVLLQHCLPDAQSNNAGGERDAGHKLPLLAEVHHLLPDMGGPAARKLCVGL